MTWQMWKWVLLVATLLGLVAVACSHRVEYPIDRVVFQLFQGGGYGIPNRAADMVPQVTLWGDGRVVFTAADSIIREGRLGRAAVDRLVNASALLFDLEEHYMAFDGTDAGYTFFTVETATGRRSVSVYGMSLDKPWPGERERATLQKLRFLYKTVVALLPHRVPVMPADEVVVIVTPARDDISVAQDWPAHLTGYLKGKDAEESVRLVGLGPAKPFRMDGKVQYVTVKPVLPILYLPWREWPQGGLPRHPAATAYNAPGQPYRFTGTVQLDVASWYRKAMADDGWKLVKEQGYDLQVWVRQKYSSDPIVLLHFQSDHFKMQLLSVDLNGIPSYPDALIGGCEGQSCKLVKGDTMGQAEAWFREYMGYLGWTEKSENLYERDVSTRSDGKRDFYEVRLEFRTVDGNTAVTQHPAFVQQWIRPPVPPPVACGSSTKDPGGVEQRYECID